LNIDTPKLPFPYDFVCESNLKYNGLIPKYEYFKDSLESEHKNKAIEKYSELSKVYESKS